MKAIQHKGVITSLSAKVDGSLGYRVNTPELDSREKALFFELQNVELELTLKPVGSENTEEYKLDKDIDKKTPSQRLRNVLFIYWKQLGSPDNYFDLFYKKEVEKMIEHYKGKLE